MGKPVGWVFAAVILLVLSAAAYQIVTSAAHTGGFLISFLVLRSMIIRSLDYTCGERFPRPVAERPLLSWPLRL